MPDGKNSVESLNGDPSASALFDMMSDAIATGKLSADQVKLLQENLPKLHEFLKDVSKIDGEAHEHYLEFLSKNQKINSKVFSERLSLLKEILDQAQNPDEREKVYAWMGDCFVEEKIGREHTRYEGTRSDKESRYFRMNAAQVASVAFAVMVVGGTAAFLKFRKD